MMRQSFVTNEVLRKIKQIEIHTRRILRGSQMGDSRSALKGTGFEFDQIREYQQGDDIRFIDWHASARMDTLLVKQFIEERSRVVMLAVDMSGSGYLGSADTLKHDIMAQVASVISMVTQFGKDRVGLILFSDEVEFYLPPGRGKRHIHTIMEYVFGYTAKSRKTNITAALKKIAQLKRRDSITFIISDFIDDALDPSYLSIASRQGDLIAVRCLDEREYELPVVGFLPIADTETGDTVLVDLRKTHQPLVHDFLTMRLVEQDKLFKKYGIRVLDVANNSSYIGDVIRFFRRHMRY